MKICYIYNPNFSGARNIVSEVEKRGHNVLHILSDKPINSSINNFIIINIKSPFALIRDLLRARAEVRKFNPDLIHVIDAGDKAIWAVALRGFKPFFVSATGSDLRDLTSMTVFGRMAQKVCLRLAAYVILNGENQMKDLLSMGIPRNRILNIYFGVPEFDSQWDVVNQATPSYKRNGYRVILTGQKFEIPYGPGLLIAIMKKVLQTRDDVIFRVAGGGSLLKWAINKLTGYEPRITFLGHLPHKDYIEELKAADIFMLATTKCDGVSVGLIESLYFGKVTIATNVGSYGELAIDMISAVVREPTLNSMLDGVTWALDNYDKALIIAKGGSRIARKKALSSYSAKKLETVYKVVVK